MPTPDSFPPAASPPPASPPPASPPPADAAARRAVAPVICYPVETLPRPDLGRYATARAEARPLASVTVPPRDARSFRVPAGGFFRISCAGGAQVGDLNLFSAADPREKFYSGKTRALHGTHLTVGDRMWSGFPYLRPMATLVADTLGWYGVDAFGGRVHDVIGTRCDPYTHWQLSGGGQYHHCCHSNLTRALMDEGIAGAEELVHDVLNVFMCTGFTADTGQYFMKASPVRPGDYLEFFAEIDLLGVLSACPGGDCGTVHSSDVAVCHPLQVDVWETPSAALDGWAPPPSNGYDRSHGR
ncbi:MAG: urea carboxylase-associated family protein [Pararhodobacter sp.]